MSQMRSSGMLAGEVLRLQDLLYHEDIDDVLNVDLLHILVIDSCQTQTILESSPIIDDFISPDDH
jgi:hypothetical protein